MTSPQPELASSSSRQKAHYEGIHDEYEEHYNDPTAREFRDRFMYDVMFEGLDLNGKTVADLASGSGHNTLALLERFPAALPTGFDISSRACEAYRAITGRPAHEADLTAGTDVDLSADVAMVIGGLHHCIADLQGTFATIAGVLKPGGLLLMCEPNRHYALEGGRRLWYRFDKYFDEQTEGALSHDEIARIAASDFEPVSCRYLGGPAYFVVLNSLVFRVPLGLKSRIAPPLFRLEHLYNRLGGRIWYPYFVARWRRVEPAGP